MKVSKKWKVVNFDHPIASSYKVSTFNASHDPGFVEADKLGGRADMIADQSKVVVDSSPGKFIESREGKRGGF